MKIINHGIINSVSRFIHADYLSANGDPPSPPTDIVELVAFIIIIIGIFLSPFIVDYFIKRRN